MAKSAQERAFVDLSSEVIALYDGGDPAAALAVIEQVESELPEHRTTIAYWKACLHGSASETERALEALTTASAAGSWWSARLLREDPDLAALQNDPRFARVVEESARRASAAQAAATAKTLVAHPQTEPRVALVALHGASWRSAEHFAQFWLPLTAMGAVVAVPQSDQPSSDEGFGWHDPQRAAAQVHGQVCDLRAQLPDGTPLILAGFSQGAALVLGWALTGDPFRPDGFIAVNPGVNGRDALISSASSSTQSPPPGVILVGDRDPRRSRIEELGTSLRDLGIACQLDVMPDTGHWFSSDFDMRARTAVAGLLEGRMRG